MSDTSDVSSGKLISFVEQIESLEKEKKATGDSIKQVYSNAEKDGFVVEALRAVVRLYKQSSNDRSEFVSALDSYWSVLGEMNPNQN